MLVVALGAALGLPAIGVGCVARPDVTENRDELSLERGTWSNDLSDWVPRWTMGGQNPGNTRNQADEWMISPRSAAQLDTQFAFQASSSISATPAVDDRFVYFPDFGGFLYKLDRKTGAQIWSHQISEYTGVPGSWSRASPAVTSKRVIVGDQDAQGAHVIAVDAKQGTLSWRTTIDPHPLAIVTQSPLVFGGRVYVGTSSREEGAAGDPSYPCCTFRGSVTALDENTGSILWTTFLSPDNQGKPGGYSGIGVWGSTPAIDPQRGTLYITTGQNYSVPPAVAECLQQRPGDLSCLAADDYVDAIVALDVRTGAIKWGTRLQGPDTWTHACFPTQLAWCPNPPGPDYDFASGPNLFSAKLGRRDRDLVGAGQKSGVYWALDADSGEVVWHTAVGPGGIAGGIMWGSATDGARIYVASANVFHIPYTLPSGEINTGGSFAALSVSDGSVLWETADPGGFPDMGAVSVANDVVFGCSLAPTTPNQYALDARTGEILWSFAAGASCNAGPAIVQGTVYWGSGYSRLGLGIPGNMLRAFTVPARALEHFGNGNSGGDQ
jgi:polyvinyl alcohol dehydrogenase (cytochrome)